MSRDWVTEAERAVGVGDLAALLRMLEEGPKGLAAAHTKDGWSLLHLAPNAEIAQALLDEGADIQARNRHPQYGPGNSPLHAAVYSNNPEVAAFLIDKGAHVNARDDNGWTPLHLAAANGYLALARLLLETGADPNAKTSRDTPAAPAGRTPLMLTQTPGRQRDDGTVIDQTTDATMAALLRQHGATD